MSVKLQEQIKNGTPQYTVTVPKSLVEAEGFEKGQKFKWVKVQGLYAIEPVR
ncbi:hypothetical protein [uncultured Methanolobus sp.]|uniref:hypothetical protein n=1 Tax=uncultured Methanolobus sp. TaxID=218300 RepID=UPI002AAB4D45|nr:hypothetical protein [uncultured Methanolobus sp.]